MRTDVKNTGKNNKGDDVLASKEKQKKIVSNTAYTIGGALLMNGVLQILIYPLLNRMMGSDQLGELLYLMGLVAILCPSVGQALNTSRLVVRRDYEVKNGDYNLLLLLFGGIGTVITLVVAKKSMVSFPVILWTAILLMTTIFRYYGDVEYRLNLNYKKYFTYYGVLTAGYVAGFGIYFLTENWFWVFVTGEAASLLYLGITGSVFHGFWKKSSFFGEAFRRGGFLVFSYLITNLTLNIDRLVLEHLIGHLAVTQYYVTSLIGKTLVLLVAPVNTIIISYLTRKQERMDRKQFLIFTGIGGAVSLAFFVGAQIGTPIFVKLFYGDLYEAVRGMVTVVNLSQILGVFSAYLFIVVLTFTEEKWQLILQIIHLAVITALVLIFTQKSGIMGFAVSVLIANGIRVAAVILLGLWKAAGTRKQGNQESEL